MNKKIVLLFFAFIILSTNIIFANGYDNDFKIRIGIHFGNGAKSKYSITGENLYIAQNGNKIWDTRSNKVEVSRVSQIYFSNEGYQSYEEAGIYSSEVFYKDGEFYPINTNGNLNTQNNIRITLANGNSLILNGDINQYIGSASDIVGIDGVLYRDFASIYNDGTKIIAVNVVGLDNYLKGVVAKEMPSSWHIEALKAQSVVARNFAISNINKYIKNGYNLDNTTASQVYGGVSAETKNTNLAVELTSGKLMYYGREIVEGYFHSSSGGRTENSENIWANAKPYLVGVDDPYSVGNVHDSWSFSMTSLELRLQLQKNGIDVGEIINVVPVYSQNGRIIELTINGRNSSYRLLKDRIRTVLGSSKIKSTYFTITTNTSNMNLKNEVLLESQFNKSNTLNDIYQNLRLIIENQNSPTNTIVSGTNFVINGKGYGHGVGLSQYGAGKMASEGFGYEEILRHYFRGIEVI